MAFHFRWFHQGPGSDVQQFPSLWNWPLASHGWVMTTILIMFIIHRRPLLLYLVSCTGSPIPQHQFSFQWYPSNGALSFSSPDNRQSTGCIVYVGVKFVNKFATVALLCVIFSIIAVYTGIFVNIDGNDRLKWVVVRLFLSQRSAQGGGNESFSSPTLYKCLMKSSW